MKIMGLKKVKLQIMNTWIPEAVVQRCSVKKVFLKNSQNSQENTCARVSFLIKFQAERLWHRCFPVNFVEFLKTPVFIEHFWWLLLFGFKKMQTYEPCVSKESRKENCQIKESSDSEEGTSRIENTRWYSYDKYKPMSCRKENTRRISLSIIKLITITGNLLLKLLKRINLFTQICHFCDS